jgi:hypothetical protein
MPVETLMPVVYFTGLFTTAVCLMIWNNPVSLFKWADRVEKYGIALIRATMRQIRIRAAAKADAQRAYRLSQARHRKVL